ncbi:MAG: N-acetyltransferase family protein [Bdellovibrio bacteriovorus]
MTSDDRLTPDTPATLHLADGTTCRIRPSGPADRDHVATCFETLSPESRRLRFFGVKPSLPPAELDFYAEADGRDHIAFAAVRIDPRGREGEALGFARCVRLADRSETAELSLTVLDQAQGQGIGAGLLAQLIRAARAQGIRHFRCEVLAENAAMRRLARRLGGKAQWLGDGILELDCALPTKPEDPPDWGLPWFADADAWVSLCSDAWLTSLAQTLARIEAANDDWDQWLGGPCPLASTSAGSRAQADSGAVPPGSPGRGR